VNQALRRWLYEHWARRLGCRAEVLREPGIHVVPALRPNALYIVRVGDCAVACADAASASRLARVGSPDRLVDGEALDSVLPSALRYVGPAFVGYAAAVRAPAEAPCRLPNARCPELDALRRAATAEEWEHAGLDDHVDPIFVALRNGVAAAAAGFEIVDEEVAHIGVLCDPARRGTGLARQVVAAAARQALAEGLTPQYQTLCSNGASMAVGRALGFERFATTMSVHLSPAGAA